MTNKSVSLDQFGKLSFAKAVALEAKSYTLDLKIFYPFAHTKYSIRAHNKIFMTY